MESKMKSIKIPKDDIRLIDQLRHFFSAPIGNRKPIAKEQLNLINQAEIARRIGITTAYVSMILSGKRTSIKVERQIILILEAQFSDYGYRRA